LPKGSFEGSAFGNSEGRIEGVDDGFDILGTIDEGPALVGIKLGDETLGELDNGRTEVGVDDGNDMTGKADEGNVLGDDIGDTLGELLDTVMKDDFPTTILGEEASSIFWTCSNKTSIWSSFAIRINEVAKDPVTKLLNISDVRCDETFSAEPRPDP